ncbi:MAG: beta strand repeat-containing protein [Acidimicrobiales bacterium]
MLTIVAEVILPTIPSASSGSSLTNVSWTTSSSQTGAPSVTYSYGFTVATGSSLSSVSFTVPSGTSGTPSLQSLKLWASTYYESVSSPTVALSGTTLTLSFAQTYLNAAQYSVQIAGLTNTSTAGAYTSTVTTSNGGTAVGTGTTQSYSFTSSALSDTFLSTSSTTTTSAGVSYSYGFVTGSSQTLTSISISVPSGTSGTPAVGSVSPAAIAGGSAALSGDILTYTFAATTVNAGTAIAVQMTGLTNTPTVGSYPGEIVTADSGTVVDSAIVSPVSFTPTLLTNLSFSPSSTSTGATGVSYTYSFTTTTGLALSSFDISVPPGTSGTPTIGSFSAQPVVTFPSPTVVLSGSQLVVSFSAVNVNSDTVVSLQINGLTNTPTAGSFSSSIVAMTSVTYRVAQVDSGVTSAVTFTSSALRSLSWTATSTSTGATGVTYGFSFGLTGTATLSSITMTIPEGTGGAPVVGTVTPSSIAGGTVSLVGQTLTYSFAPTSVSSSVTVSVAITGLTNTSVSGSYVSTITAYDAGNAVASGPTPSVGFTATVLSNLSWGASSTLTATTGVSYTYQMTTGSAQNLTSFTMSVPTGTSGTPTVGSFSAIVNQYNSVTPSSLTVALSGTTLKLSFTLVYFPSGTVVSIQINGLTNTLTPGSYTSSITTYNATTSVDSGTTPAVAFNSTVLGSPTWSTSSNAVGVTAVGYTYSFGFPDTAQLTTITMTVPSGTRGTASVGAVSPGSIAGGTASLSGNLLTYTFPAVSVSAGSIISVELTGITNTSTAGSYTSTITASDSGTAAASGSTPAVALTSTVLTGLTWATSSTFTGATGVNYTFGFKTSSNDNLTQVSATVPPGTGGAPAVGAVSAGTVTISSTSVSLSGTTLTFSFGAVYVPSGTTFSIQITGLTNTATPGSYNSAVSTKNGGATLDSGTTPLLGFYAASVSLTPPSSLGWSAGLSASGVDVVNEVTGGQQYGVADQTGTNNGWNVALSATTFTNGSHSLSDTGTFWTNGSLNLANSTSGPSVTCISACVMPTNQVTYPVAISTAAASPSSVVIFSAATGTGSGAFTIGGF